MLQQNDGREIVNQRRWGTRLPDGLSVQLKHENATKALEKILVFVAPLTSR
jgi:hypothetical protein